MRWGLGEVQSNTNPERDSVLERHHAHPGFALGQDALGYGETATETGRGLRLAEARCELRQAREPDALEMLNGELRPGERACPSPSIGTDEVWLR